MLLGELGIGVNRAEYEPTCGALALPWLVQRKTEQLRKAHTNIDRVLKSASTVLSKFDVPRQVSGPSGGGVPPGPGLHRDS